MTKLEEIELELKYLRERYNQLMEKKQNVLNEKTTVKLRITAQEKMKLSALAKSRGKTMGEMAGILILRW